MDNDYAYAFWFAYLPIVIGILQLGFGADSGFIRAIKLFAGFLVIGALILGVYLYIRARPKQWLLWLMIALGIVAIIPAILYVTNPALLADYVKALIGIYALGLIIGLVMLRATLNDYREIWWPFIGAVSSLTIISIIFINYLLTVQPA